MYVCSFDDVLCFECELLYLRKWIDSFLSVHRLCLVPSLQGNIEVGLVMVLYSWIISLASWPFHSALC